MTRIAAEGRSGAREREMERTTEATPPSPKELESRKAEARLRSRTEVEHGSGRHDDRVLCDFVKNVALRCPVEFRGKTTAFIRGAGDANAIDPNDIKQGPVGDCYLMAPLVALAASPGGRARIREMIHEHERGGEKHYEVTFRVPVKRTPLGQALGKPPYEEVKIDVGEQFDRRRAKPADRAGNQQEVWPQVIEAAYQKLKATHSGITNGGFPRDPFTLISGLPTAEKTITPAQMLADATAGRPMAVTVARPTTPAARAAQQRLGFEHDENHVYAVKRVFTKGGQAYVQLHNPWGINHPKTMKVADLAALPGYVAVSPPPQLSAPGAS